MMVVRILAAALLCAASAAAVAASEAPASGSGPRDAGKKDEIVCTSEQTLGSHLPRKTCTTRAASEERKRRDQEAMRNLHTAPAHHPGKD